MDNKRRMNKAPRSSKHKKLKAVDPFYKGERKDALLNRHGGDKMNQPPSKDEEQHLPRSFTELVHLKDTVKQSKASKNKFALAEAMSRTMAPDTRGCSKSLKSIPKFQQRKGEKDSRFINRIDRESFAVINRTQMESKFKVSYEEGENGQMKIKKKRKNKKKIEKDRKKVEVHKERDQNRRDKNKSGFEKLQDDVAFGDIVHRPPEITAAPRKAPQNGKNKSKSLQLSSLLKNKAGAKCSLAKRDMLDKERTRIVKLYRQQKKLNQITANTGFE